MCDNINTDLIADHDNHDTSPKSTNTRDTHLTKKVPDDYKLDHDVDINTESTEPVLFDPVLNQLGKTQPKSTDIVPPPKLEQETPAAKMKMSTIAPTNIVPPPKLLHETPAEK